jgi:hypothetical protein
LNGSDESLFSGDIYQENEKIFEEISKLKNYIATQTELRSCAEIVYKKRNDKIK